MIFGEWLPDLPDHGHGGMVEVCNVIPSSAGYVPVGVLSEVTAALPETWKGGGGFAGVDGSQVLLAGANGGLYEYTSGAWVLDKSGTYTANWHFAQFGDLVICCNGAAPLKYTIASATGATLGGSPPNADYPAIVRDFVFLAGNSSAVSTVYWSAINNAEGWTIGTDQADSQLIPDGGAITGLAGGEYGLVFQQDAINLFEYVGLPAIFTRRKISDSIGCMAHGSIAQAGRVTFFLSRRGFYMFNEGELRAIGEQRIDKSFFDLYSISEIENSIRSAIDPQKEIVIWSMPGRLWVYHWGLDRWTKIDITGATAITTGRTASSTLEQIAVTFPSIEDVTPPLDDPSWNGGEPQLWVVKTDNKLHSFSEGTNMSACFRLPRMEIGKGRWAHVRNAQLQSDAVEATLNLFYAPRLGDAFMSAQTTTVRDNGDMPIRATGRFFQAEVILSEGADWSYMQGVDLEASESGRR